MDLKSKLIKKTDIGELYKVYDNDTNNIYFKLRNVKLLYNIQKYKKVFYLKWSINNSEDSNDIRILEDSLRKHFNLELVESNVKVKYDGIKELTTKLKISKDYYNIIETIDVLEEFLEKGQIYDIILYPFNVYIENSIIKYSLYFKKILKV